MSATGLYTACGLVLFVLGLHAVFARRDRMGRVLALNVMGGGAFLVLVSLGARGPRLADGRPDPVPQALVLTGLVVSVSLSAVALAIPERDGAAGTPPDDHAPPHG